MGQLNVGKLMDKIIEATQNRTLCWEKTYYTSLGEKALRYTVDLRYLTLSFMSGWLEVKPKHSLAAQNDMWRTNEKNVELSRAIEHNTEETSNEVALSLWEELTDGE